MKQLLSHAWGYGLLQNLVGAPSAIRWMAANFWKPIAGNKIVDCGCGTGSVLEYLPAGTDYVGFDLSEEYIESARRRYGVRGTFLLGTARDLLNHPDPRLQSADLVLCNGLLHHLNDGEVIEVLELARHLLSPTGRLIAWEPTFLCRQTFWSRWIMRQDRGQFIRTEDRWKEIVAQVFPRSRSWVLTGLYRIPYIHLVFECRTPAAEDVTLNSVSRPC